MVIFNNSRTLQTLAHDIETIEVPDLAVPDR
jgi:hypothetical protein